MLFNTTLTQGLGHLKVFCEKVLHSVEASNACFIFSTSLLVSPMGYLGCGTQNTINLIKTLRIMFNQY